jgi:DNA polymerase-3 subunit delta'
VIGISQLIERTLRDISQNANAKISFFDFTLKIIVLLIPRRK